MYYTVYKIVNQINGKIYIGVHKTENLDDGYMGSGNNIIRAQDKYGIENFKKEYLSIFDNSEDMFNMESQLVNSEFIKREDTYNIKEGGFGGFDHINSNKLLSEENIKRLRTYNSSSKSLVSRSIARDTWVKKVKDPEYRKEFCKKNSERRQKYNLSHSGTFLGKKHSEETKRKMSESKVGKCSGENNSSFGKIWIYNSELGENKMIKTDFLTDYISQGWERGRKYIPIKN